MAQTSMALNRFHVGTILVSRDKLYVIRITGAKETRKKATFLNCYRSIKCHYYLIQTLTFFD